MSSRFTPGPWRTGVGRFPHVIYAESNLSRILARVTLDEGATNRERNYADARLIAAAPDLYAALERVVRIANRKTDEFDAARAALAKARGES